jgi:uncharacterized protein YidB (DUF937 family)
MGLLDSLLGSMSNQGGGNPMLDAVMKLVNDPAHGGLAGLVQSFQQRGLGGIVDSWVSTGQNLPISPDQLSQALGSDQLGALAQSLGVDQAELSSKLSGLLPDVVDKLTPNGQVPDSGDLGSLLDSVTKHLR